MADGIAIDPSSFQPLQASPVTAPAAPATAPQAAPVSIDSSSFQPLSTQSSPAPTASDAIFGKNTALGAATPQKWSAELSGVGDVLKGNIRQGLGKVYDSENGSMHVVQGSPIEKIIQTFNPSFQGGITPTEFERQHHETYAPLENPVVDAAQFIDKEKHPIWKAVAESAQSLTSPENVAIMASTGGFGLVESPKALGMANRLLSSGFSAQAIGQAYQHLKDFKDAYDSGNTSEALYQLTHSVLSGALAYTAGSHATGNEMDLARPGIQQDTVDLAKTGAGKVSGAVGQASQAVKGVAGDAADFLKSAVTQDKGFLDVMRRSSPPTKGNSMEYGTTLANAEPQLKEVLKRNPDATTPKDMYDALDRHIKGQEGLLQAKAEQFRGKPQAQMPNIHSDILNAVDTAFKDAGGQYTAEERRSALDAIENHLLQEAGKTPKGVTLYRNPDLFEAEGIRQRFSEDANPVFGSNAPSVPKAEAFAKAAAAAELRNQIDAKYDQLGVGNVKEWRKQEAALIDVRDQIANADKKANEMGDFSLWNSLVKQFGWKIPISLVAGMGVGGFEGAAGLGAGTTLISTLHDYLRDVRTNPNRLLERASKMANEQGPSGAATPTFKKPGPVPVSEGYDWEQHENRIPEGQTPEGLLGHELGHAFVGNNEGFNPIDVISREHPESPKKSLAAARFSMDNIDIQPNGTVTKETMTKHLGGLLRLYMSGAAADSVFNGIDVKKNQGARGDIHEAIDVLKRLGYSPTDARAKMQTAYDQAVEHLSQPHISDTIKEAVKSREPDLPDSHHFSTERLYDLFRQAEGKKNGKASGNEAGDTAGVRQLDKASEAGREGSGADGAGSETPGVSEISTGDGRVDDLIRKAGGIPQGTSLGLVYFREPKSGSTLALKAADVTPEAISKKLQDSQASFEKPGQVAVIEKPSVKGMKVPGNINLNGRPLVPNKDGSYSSEKSFSIGTDKGEVLIPQVVNGKMLSQKEAIEHYLKTGEHMGIFDTPENADAYAEMIHNRVPTTTSGRPNYEADAAIHPPVIPIKNPLTR